ncbi:hypothetical protein [Mycobacteroides abscessus]|uniref:hypothetical protein n=1 Tax=Mycobacteroides abscessus TaxID=36809 RepID=UPI0016023AEB|nr:hypothetical protein [Mycobacteroides abscessus]
MNDWEATAIKLGGISRTMVFRLWKSGGLKSVQIGSRRFSTDAQIADYITLLETVAV